MYVRVFDNRGKGGAERVHPSITNANQTHAYRRWMLLFLLTESSSMDLTFVLSFFLSCAVSLTIYIEMCVCASPS